jgi:hypothetical protein
MRVYSVGGAVRDKVLGRAPKDQDFVVTGSSPEEMLSFGFTQVGADFPVFLHPETKDEWALARIERKVGAGYHGFETIFDATVSIEDDLRRRDFTMNAMAIEVNCVESHGVLMTNEIHESPIIDPFGGMNDLKMKIIRHTSEAFSEDPLRVLRLARFVARYGFATHADTLALCSDIVDSGEMDHVSYERFWNEIERAVHERFPEMFFRVLGLCGVLRNVNFFHIWLGDMKRSKLEWIMDYSQAMGKGDDPTSMLVVLSVADNIHSDVLKMSNSISQRANALWFVGEYLKDGFSAKSLYDCLRHLGVWKKESNWNGMLSAMEIYESLAELPDGTVVLIGDLGQKVQDLTAANLFPGEEGVNVGKKLAAARIEFIEMYLKDRKLL